jgi:hypothetical protein
MKRRWWAMSNRSLGKGEVVGSIPTGSTSFPLIKSITYEHHAGSDKEQNGPGKWQKSGATRAKSVRWVEPSSLRSGSRLEPPHGFSGVADAANINGLAGSGWQKHPVAFYSGGASG